MLHGHSVVIAIKHIVCVSVRFIFIFFRRWTLLVSKRILTGPCPIVVHLLRPIDFPTVTFSWSRLYKDETAFKAGTQLESSKGS